jgi:hypothetical protein
MRTLIPAAALLVAAPLAGLAQTPTLQQPSTTSLALPIEVVSAKVAPMAPGSLYYERAGLKPREFRVGSTSQMTDATWTAFREGSTTTKTVNGRTVITGTLTYNPVLGPACSGTNTVKVRSFLQFRATDPSGKTYISNIKGDSACVFLGG